MNKKFLALLIIFILALSLTGCGDVQTAGEEKLVLGENAFEVWVYLRNLSTEPITAMVEPDRFNSGPIDLGYGTMVRKSALVRGTQNGENVDFDGSFTIYANGKSGPSVIVELRETCTPEQLKNRSEPMIYYAYENAAWTRTDGALLMKPVKKL